jgi:hypothetical protein
VSASHPRKGYSADPQLFEDKNDEALDASFAGHMSVESSPQPACPASDVPPEPGISGSLLIKAASTCCESLQAFCRWRQLARWVNTVAKEIYTAVDTTEKAFISMQSKAK